ncbi:unnamed protein product [Mycena citricolor]|uniref:Uncharacterized protein n=1 Tax=Mycena citricolor TaxID=2018698 RepID=A0AAD2H8J4_9AGAR|nr:unnamed protein product [Mycena citricolor]
MKPVTVPVLTYIPLVHRGNAKLLNRQGRAICRIMSSLDWDPEVIGYIFGVSSSTVVRAVENVFYTPRDRVEEDFDRVGEEYQTHAPRPPADQMERLRAIKNANRDEEGEEPVVVPPRTKRTVTFSSRPANVEGDLASVRKRFKPTPVASSDSCSEQHTSSSSRQNSGFYGASTGTVFTSASQRADSRESFLSSLSSSPSITPPIWTQMTRDHPPVTFSHELLPPLEGFDPRKHVEVFHSKGLTSAHRLRTLALWPRNMIQETVKRMFLGAQGMSAMDIISFEIALGQMKKKSSAAQQSAILASSRLSSSPPPTLHRFLLNVMGLDLSLHQNLLIAQGIDIQTLCKMTEWDPESLRDALERMLGEGGSLLAEGQVGMVGFEVLALEWELRRTKLK